MPNSQLKYIDAQSGLVLMLVCVSASVDDVDVPTAGSIRSGNRRRLVWDASVSADMMQDLRRNAAKMPLECRLLFEA